MEREKAQGLAPITSLPPLATLSSGLRSLSHLVTSEMGVSTHLTRLQRRVGLHSANWTPRTGTSLLSWTLVARPCSCPGGFSLTAGRLRNTWMGSPLRQGLPGTTG